MIQDTMARREAGTRSGARMQLPEVEQQRQQEPQ